MTNETQAAIIERDGELHRLTMWFNNEQDARAALDAAEQRGAARGWQPIDSAAHHATVPRLVLVRESAYPNGRMTFACLSGDGVWRECGWGQRLPVEVTHWFDIQVPVGLQNASPPQAASSTEEQR